jgi:hypothetical protein
VNEFAGKVNVAPVKRFDLCDTKTGEESNGMKGEEVVVL